MYVELLHYTPNYHKLIENVARTCYQSFKKESKDSHMMLKGIMNKGHLSVASVGNIVFGIKVQNEIDYMEILDELSIYKQINNFVRWTDISHKDNIHSKYSFVLSMNILSLLDIYKSIDDFDTDKKLTNKIISLLKDVPEIYWFIDNNTKIKPIDNPYKLNANLGSPVILTEDYTYLKDYLTEYEMNVHATVTVNLAYDRATSLQIWRHGDNCGGTELSQRYVNLDNAKYRTPIDLDEEHKEIYKEYVEQEITFYSNLKEKLSKLGKKRSQEIARSLLPNAVLTNTVQCRPLRQWKHLIKLRDSKHAQLEVMQDTQALKKEFEKLGISF